MGIEAFNLLMFFSEIEVPEDAATATPDEERDKSDKFCHF
jgi:hypothetical protein